MGNEQTVICTDKQINGILITITYKHGHNTPSTFSVGPADSDYQLAKQLQVGDEFTIEMQNQSVQSIPGKFDIKPGMYQFEYIKRIIGHKK